MNENQTHNREQEGPLVMLGQGDYEKRFSPVYIDLAFDYLILPFRWLWRLCRRLVKRSRAVVHIEEGV